MKTLDNKYSTFRAYAHGTLDGYTTGYETNPHDPEENPEEHQAYKLGYDYGVFLYCEENGH